MEPHSYDIKKESLLILAFMNNLEKLKKLSGESKELYDFLKDDYVLEELSLVNGTPYANSLNELFSLFPMPFGQKLIYAVEKNDFESTERMLTIISSTKPTWYDWRNYEKAVQIAQSLGYDEILQLLLRKKINRQPLPLPLLRDTSSVFVTK